MERALGAGFAALLLVGTGADAVGCGSVDAPPPRGSWSLAAGAGWVLALVTRRRADRRGAEPRWCQHHGGRSRPPLFHREPAHAMMRRVSAVASVNGSIQRVMVGTDLSQTASKAVEWAVDFAGRFDAELHLVQVIVPAHPSDTEFGAAERTQAAGAAEALQAEAMRLAGDAWTLPRGHRHRPRDGDRRRGRGRRDRRPRRRQRRDGGQEGIPARQRAQPDQSQRALHGDHRQHHRRRDDGKPPRPLPACSAPALLWKRPSRT